LDEVRRRGSDSYWLLLFQVARDLSPQAPARAARDDRTVDHLRELAAGRPEVVAEMIESALRGVRPLVTPGRGGDRNRGGLTDKDLVFELGVIFRAAAGRPRGITGDAYAVGDARYAGPFVKFVQIVTGALGRKMSARKVYRLHRRLKAEERVADLTQDQRRERALKRLETIKSPDHGASAAQ
jgi:hypothetical protein